ncbi:MAG TPA: hypothetical protein VMT46_09095 [Anaerolineaceae bacterium]|nr:hypothetical protein [Anaerolineaceae bacterium]
MSNHSPITAENNVEREHLVELIGKLSDQDLNHPLESGWTVSAVLAHLAFWDLRALTLLKKWAVDGVGPSPIDTDVVNEVVRHHCLAIAPPAAAHLAISAADAVDREIAQLTPRQMADIQEKGDAIHLNRANHRREHLEQIERALDVKK